MTGMASIGSQLSIIFRLDAAATVELFPPGDYNRDGTVDAADYVVWRKNEGTQAGYDTWRSHFGETDASGSSSNASVPEQGSAILLIFAAAIGSCTRLRVFSPASLTR